MSPLPPVPPLPTPCLSQPSPAVSLLLPLSRRGVGPGLIILVPHGVSPATNLQIKDGVPSLMMKWTEEGYTVALVTQSALENDGALVLEQAVDALTSSERCEPKDRIGVIAYNGEVWNNCAPLVSSIAAVKAVVVYAAATEDSTLVTSNFPTLRHYAGKTSTGQLKRSLQLLEYDYASVESIDFALPFHEAFDYRLEAISHTRNLTHLKKHMDGPYFDLEHIWDEHTYYEFENRSVEHTMSTMVAEPYVNHIPTLMGGIGRENLTAFYRDHFIFKNPQDTEMQLISRTVGIDRVVDEFVFAFTHTSQVDWLIPGVLPTGRHLRIPFNAVVNIRGDRLYHEHISWDQATVLRQLEILPTCLPFPYPVVGRDAEPGTENVVQLPVAGVETANKMADRNSVPSNKMIAFQVKSVEKIK
ncbi:NTF2-like protein [Penicillium angulare]|uniref:NTF2-like protein n=1 Tax=Penicillium angulare TaxID=116970 RepID=A0A9W9G897_9EURO|nr:NTF2-like protein [Penicillium angulare]